MPAVNLSAEIIKVLANDESTTSISHSAYTVPTHRDAVQRGLFIPKEVLSLEVSWSERLVLSEVMNLVKVSGKVWAGDQHLAERCRLSKRAVGNALQQLERSGFIRRITRQSEKQKRKLILLFSPATFCSNNSERDQKLLQDLPEPIAITAAELSHHLPQPVADSAEINTHSTNRLKIKQITSAEKRIESIKSTLQPSVGMEPNVAALFDEFWNKYGKKIDRFNCERKWAKLSATDQSAILAHVDGYVAATLEIQYRKHPLTYLTCRSWIDEHLPSQTPTPSLRGGGALPSPASTSYSISTIFKQQANTHII